MMISKISKNRLSKKTKIPLFSLPHSNICSIKEVEPKDILLENLLENVDEYTSNQFKDAGQQLFVYRKIRYTNMEKQNVFFHLCWCTILNNTKKQSLKNYFYATTRHDGIFTVTFRTDGKKDDIIETKLYVCRACFEKLKLANKNYNMKNFDIDRYYREQLFAGHKMDDKTISLYLEQNLDHYVYDWNKIREYILRKFDYTCQECGKRIPKGTDIQNDIRLEVHHINKDKRDNSDKNLQLLCSECHDKKHPNRPKN